MALGDWKFNRQIEQELRAAIRQDIKQPSQQAKSRDTDLDPKKSRVEVFDPGAGRLSLRVDDAVFESIHFLWKDRQQHGRLTYEAMMKHPAVSAPMEAFVTFLKTYKPIFKPQTKNPTKRQKEMADFLNTQIMKLSMSGDARQGYDKLIDGLFGNSLEFGFGLAEMETEVSPWRGKDMIQVKKIRVLPQASLDAGFQPLEEFGETVLFNDPRYRCFTLDEQGEISAIHQFRNDGSSEKRVTWSGKERKRILHAIHKGGDGNPFGQSMLYSAFYAWASLYTIEQLEEVFLDAGLPYLTASYKTPDGRPSPELHNTVIELISEQDPSRRLLIGPDMTWGSTAPSNANFTDHVTKKKEELRRYVSQALLMPSAVYSSTDESEGDARNLIQVFFKYIATAALEEIKSVLTWQIGKRLIDANYSHLEIEDYPVVAYSTILDNDLRVAQAILAQVLPYVDADKLGEAVHAFLPPFDPTWIPEKHSDSVEVKRPRRDSNDEPNNITGSPPPKEDGEVRQRMDGQTENPSGSMDTEAGVGL